MKVHVTKTKLLAKWKKTVYNVSELKTLFLKLHVE
jgi:hypothetical protein